MKPFKSIFCILGLTLLSLLYVHSEIEAVKLGYVVKNNQEKVTKLLDQNRSLMYNVASLRSPSSLERSLMAKRSDYYMPKQTILVKNLESKPKNTVLVKSTIFKKGLFNFFEPKDIAQAEEKQ